MNNKKLKEELSRHNEEEEVFIRIYFTDGTRATVPIDDIEILSNHIVISGKLDYQIEKDCEE